MASGIAKRKTTSDVIFEIVNVAVLVLCCVIVIYPIYYMLMISLSDGYAVMRGEVGLLPVGINLTAYKAVLSNPDIPTSYWNTVVYTVVGTLIAVAMTALCAYPLSRKKFYGRNLFTFFIIFTMFFDAGMISNFMVVDSLNLINTIWAIVLPGAINAWNMVVMRTFFQQLPEELFESSYLDGANDLIIFWKIVLPLSVPTIATMILFYAVGHWNSWFSALIYLDDKAKYPVQLIMRNIVLSGETTAMSSSASSMTSDLGIISTNIKYAVVFITMLPILIVYPFVQKHFVKGIMVGALKG